MTITGKTDVGKVRTSNQDAFSSVEFDNGDFCIVVCDGMGGHVGGNIASETAIEAFKKQLQLADEASLKTRNIISLLTTAVNAANDAVFSKAVSDPELQGMGTTIVTVFCRGGEYYVAHVGDSRAYFFDGENLTRLTKDHSVVQEMIDNGEITEDEANTHPYKHVITRVLGVYPEVQPEVSKIEITAPGRILICSDGLSNMIPDEDLTEILSIDEDLPIVCDVLIGTANERGGNDNITAVVAEI